MLVAKQKAAIDSIMSSAVELADPKRRSILLSIIFLRDTNCVRKASKKGGAFESCDSVL